MKSPYIKKKTSIERKVTRIEKSINKIIRTDNRDPIYLLLGADGQNINHLENNK